MTPSGDDTATLLVELDRSGEVPVGVQLGWKLRALILDGTLAPGRRLPPVRELAVSAGVNPNTIRSVYGRLESEGLIVAEHGRGTFVAGGGFDGGDAVRLAARAAREAQRAGLDPREVAAALYVSASPAESPAAAPRRPPESPPPDRSPPRTAPVSERARLRLEVEALERELASLKLEQVLSAETASTLDQPRTAPRLLSEDDLRRVRDDLARQVTALTTTSGELRAAARERRSAADREPADTNTLQRPAPTGTRRRGPTWSFQPGWGHWRASYGG